MNLDDLTGRRAVDAEQALDHVLATGDQWRGAGQLDVSVALHPDVQAVLVVGMGGSGIAGDVVAAAGGLPQGVPLLVHKGYGLPAWVSMRTLVVAVSHSGTTEETLDALEAAIARGARVAAVTSGGTVAELVEPRGPVALVPAAGQPRHNAGWLAGGLARLLGCDAGLTEAGTVTDAVTRACGPDVDTTGNAAKRVAARIAEHGGTTLVWGAPGVAGVGAYRLACQLNENAELPAWPMALPELDHNAVVGWQHEAAGRGLGGLVVVRDAREHPRMQDRVEVSLPLVRERVAWTAELLGQGNHPLARLAGVMVKADLVSLYTALALDRDPTPIAPIAQLKAEMASRRDREPAGQE